VAAGSLPCHAPGKVMKPLAKDGRIPFLCAVIGGWAASSFLPSPSLVLCIGGVLLFLSLSGYRPYSGISAALDQAMRFETGRDRSAVYGCGLVLGAAIEYAIRYF